VDFVALDFETADYGRESACAVALVRVQGHRVVAREHRLVRPPSGEFAFTWVHGITREDVEREPVFGDLWPDLAPMLEGASFLAAHNAPFDRGVLRACCEGAGLAVPALPFLCTVRLARSVWDVYPTRLPDVCRRLGLPLRHHHAGSDAEACAGIVLRALHEKGPDVLDDPFLYPGGGGLRGPTASGRRGRPWRRRSGGRPARA
jgi:DNA polymerase-3 subunit epsilon